MSSPTLLASHFGAEEVRADDVDANYNVTPRAEVPIVAVSGEARVVDRVRWGLVPWFAKDLAIGDKLINARQETITTKPAYRRAFERRRCIVPADGFYEWRARPGARARQPYFIHATDGEPLAFAGLWENWFDPAIADDPPRVRSCTIVTTVANDDLEPLHSRMPVVLPASVWSSWLDPANDDTDALRRLLVPAPNGDLTYHPVRTLVNNADNNGPELVEPAEPEEPELTLPGLEL